MSNIILNKSNIVPNSNNNKLVYDFPRDMVFTKENQIVLSHLNLYFSWFNISAKNNNNFFQYRWIDDSINDVLIPDGYYSISLLNNLLVEKMFENQHCLQMISNTQNYMFFLKIKTNSTFYNSEIELSSIGPSVEINGIVSESSSVFATPTNWDIPSTFIAPALIIPSNSKFGELIGFYPGQTIEENIPDSETENKTYTITSNTAPEVEPQSSYIITCNLVKNRMSQVNSVLTSFTVANSIDFGDIISFESELWSDIAPGHYSQLEINIFDQNMKPLQILDSTMLLVLSIK